MEIQIGQEAALPLTLNQSDFDCFAELSGDDNPIHVDPEFSARTRFGRTVAHGMLLYSHICRLLGDRLPGPGALQLEQELVFPAPTFAGEENTLRLEVTALPAPGLVELSTAVTRPDGKASLQGRTLVRLPGAHALSLYPISPPPEAPQPETDVLTCKGLWIGQSAAFKRTYTWADLETYRTLSGDTNPLHCSDDYAHQLGFQGAILPGPLLGGLFSYLLGTHLPGGGTNWLKLRLAFLAPAYPGQELTASVEVVRLRPEKDLVNLRTVCSDPGGEMVCRGEALVLIKDWIGGCHA